MIDNLKKVRLLFIALAIMFLTAGYAAAQDDEMTDTTPKITLRSGASARSGTIGGEGHASYVIRARKGQTITLEITRRVGRGGNFNLTVSKNANFFKAKQVRFGRETSSRTTLRWTGTANTGGNYYFYLTAYPTTSYRIRATVR